MGPLAVLPLPWSPKSVVGSKHVCVAGKLRDEPTIPLPPRCSRAMTAADKLDDAMAGMAQRT